MQPCAAGWRRCFLAELQPSTCHVPLPRCKSFTSISVNIFIATNILIITGAWKSGLVELHFPTPKASTQLLSTEAPSIRTPKLLRNSETAESAQTLRSPRFARRRRGRGFYSLALASERHVEVCRTPQSSGPEPQPSGQGCSRGHGAGWM